MYTFNKSHSLGVVDFSQPFLASNVLQFVSNSNHITLLPYNNGLVVSTSSIFDCGCM